MSKQKIIADILTEMAKDDNIDIDLACEVSEVAYEVEELYNLMKLWKLSSKSNKKYLINKMQEILESYKLFGMVV